LEGYPCVPPKVRDNDHSQSSDLVGTNEWSIIPGQWSARHDGPMDMWLCDRALDVFLVSAFVRPPSHVSYSTPPACARFPFPCARGSQIGACLCSLPGTPALRECGDGSWLVNCTYVEGLGPSAHLEKTKYSKSTMRIAWRVHVHTVSRELCKTKAQATLKSGLKTIDIHFEGPVR